LTRKGVWGIVNFRGAARQSYSIKIVSGYIKSQEDFGIIMVLKGLELEYRIIAINKSGEGAASNMVMVVL